MKVKLVRLPPLLGAPLPQLGPGAAGYQDSPRHLAAIIMDVLNEEQKTLDAAREVDEDHTKENPQVPVQTQRQGDIEQRVTDVKNKVQAIHEDVKSLEELQEAFHFKCQTYKIQASSNQNDAQQLAKILQRMLNDLDRLRKEILARLKDLLGRCETLVHLLEKKLGEWARRQQKACLGAPVDVHLSLLETWITGSVEAFLQLRRLLQELAGLPRQVTYLNDPLKTDLGILRCRINELLTCLLNRAFVVVEQPCMCFPCKRPLLLQTGSYFSVSARLLVKLQEPLQSSKVTVSMDKNPPSTKGYRSFNIKGTLKKVLCMDDVQKKGLMADFKDLTLKKQTTGVKRKGSKGTNDVPVTEELHLIHFNMQFKYQELKIEIENLTFFSNPPDALWTDLASALSWQFSSATQRGLNDAQLLMLAKKLCGQLPKSDSQVKWAKFSKVQDHFEKLLAAE